MNATPSSEATAVQPAPHSYVVILHRSLCRCGTLSEHSELYEQRFLRSRWGTQLVKNLKPMQNSPQYNLPIEVVLRPIQNIAFCHECATQASLTHLPFPAEPEDQRIIGTTNVVELLIRAKGSSKVGARSTVSRTLDDLLGDL